MADLLFRTEDIPNSDFLDLYVETTRDREILNKIKSVSPIILVGSRGVGKSFLMKVAEQELHANFQTDKTLAIYLTFTKSSLIHTNDEQQFTHWMLALICSKVIRELRKKGLLANIPSAVNMISGGDYDDEKISIEEIAKQYEDSWKNPDNIIDTSNIPSIDDFKDTIEDICSELGLKRINLLIDEAAHIFRPEQQRQFFTLFRDLRSPYISCNAAVYPGVTSYGDIFQYSQDATFIDINRDVMSSTYIEWMHEIIEKQSESNSKILNEISTYKDNFKILAFAASGNPRFFLKSIGKSLKLNSKSINTTLREFYKVDLLAEHTALSEKYPGQKGLIDWGREFIEEIVLPDLLKKNESYLVEQKPTTTFIWLHKDVPQTVKEAIRLLEYTGIVQEHSKGIKATKAEIGTRYLINIGCVFAQAATPSKDAVRIAQKLTSKRMTEFGMNNSNFRNLIDEIPSFIESDLSEILQLELSKSIDVLDLSNWIKDTLKGINLLLVKDILNATEANLKSAHYVGNKRARLVKTAAISSVYEYLNG